MNLTPLILSPNTATPGNIMSKTIEIKAPSELRSILYIFSAFDKVRWRNTGNYNLINYCEEDFTPDEKLLTHWLCYIADRQTAFQRVWDVGGYVLSHLVREFTKRHKTPDWTIPNDHLEFEDGLRLKCPLVRPNARLKFYGVDSNDVEFTSRYMPADVLSIYRTLIILDRVAECSFTRFMFLAVKGETDQRKAVRKLAAALQFLTYADIGNVNENSVRERTITLRTDLEEDLSAFMKDSSGFVAKLADDFDSFGKKRLWCSIRDYLKSPEFNNYLVAALETIDRNEADRWRREKLSMQKEALAEMELPGDVWNNNTIFRDGLFSPHHGPTPKSWDMPRTVRGIYDILETESPGTSFYPEQLDVTFDFVPRMCARLQCHRCIFGGGIEIEKMCHQQSGFSCPVTLAACGYFYPCNPDNCAFKSDSVRGVCQSSIFKPVCESAGHNGVSPAIDTNDLLE